MATTRNIMPCPVCRTELVPTERQSIEIDACPSCRGVWLDRGELDKIIERSAQAFAPQPAAAAWSGNRHDGDHRAGNRHDGDRHNDDRRHHPGKKRKSFFEELFD
jgi:Zn-finger nucleic acid-binding protein